ncbi:small multidrug export protein [Anaerofustis stercorihominis]|uniref:Small multidrug export protein n=2 Tax=Anaerofustis stercorihominis TaxID=214853 RepID=A0A3E3E266_9FIRM|nr:small multi-drug export protein [Anaerofustis stercorihominis]RGD75662.1 small multidrug export protein [Anaerofustis stercorihominis]
MVPIIELRGGLPVGIASGLSFPAAYIAAVIGNLIPVPFIILFIRRIFVLIRKYMPKLSSMIDKLENKAHLKGQKVRKYQKFGLFIFVAIPLPGTGAWTGALVAAFLDIRLKDAILPIVLGVLTAGILIMMLTYGVTTII